MLFLLFLLQIPNQLVASCFCFFFRHDAVFLHIRQQIDVETVEVSLCIIVDLLMQLLEPRQVDGVARRQEVDLGPDFAAGLDDVDARDLAAFRRKRGFAQFFDFLLNLPVRGEEHQAAQGVDDHLDRLLDQDDGQDDGDARVHVRTDETQRRAKKNQVQHEGASHAEGAEGVQFPDKQLRLDGRRGVLLVSRLQDHYDIHNLFTKEDALTTFFVSLVRSERFGEGSALGRANIIIYNYLEEAGAFRRKESGQYSLDLARMEAALSELTALVLKTQATGDRAFATYFENCYSKRSANFDADLMNLGIEKIPADIRFK